MEEEKKDLKSDVIFFLSVKWITSNCYEPFLNYLPYSNALLLFLYRGDVNRH